MAVQVQAKLYTADELLEIADRSGIDVQYELVRGELVEMPPATSKHSIIGAEMVRLIANHVRPNRLGYLTGADGGYILFTDPDTMRAPDVGFVARARGPIPQKYFPGTPDLAVEVVLPGDTASQMRDKALDDLRAGTHLVWVIYPDSKTVDVYHRAEGKIHLNIASLTPIILPVIITPRIGSATGALPQTAGAPPTRRLISCRGEGH